MTTSFNTACGPSQLWARTLHKAPSGPIWTGTQTTCILCGDTVKPGDPAIAAKEAINESFNNKLDCHEPGDAVCGYCNVLWEREWMQANSKSYAIDGEGVFRLASHEDMASFVLNPPTGPYVAIYNTRQQQHMIWRTPVTMPDSRMLQVRVDDDIVTVDRERVLAAHTHWQYATRTLQDHYKKPQGQPYLLAYQILGKAHAGNRKLVMEHDEQGKQAIAFLDTLTWGDWWMFASIRNIDIANTESWPARREIES